MRRRIRNVIQIEVEGASLENASNLEFYVKQEHGECKIYYPTVVDDSHIEVEIPLEDAMQLRLARTEIQLAYTNLNGYPVATEVTTVQVADLLKAEGYEDA